MILREDLNRVAMEMVWLGTRITKQEVMTDSLLEIENRSVLNKLIIPFIS